MIISKETMGGLAHSSESDMSESYAIKYRQLSFYFYFSLTRLRKTSSGPVLDHPQAPSKGVPELTSFVFPLYTYISFLALHKFAFLHSWTISGLLGFIMCHTNQKKPNPALFGALNATAAPSLKVR